MKPSQRRRRARPIGDVRRRTSRVATGDGGGARVAIIDTGIDGALRGDGWLTGIPRQPADDPATARRTTSTSTRSTTTRSTASSTSPPATARSSAASSRRSRPAPTSRCTARSSTGGTGQRDRGRLRADPRRARRRADRQPLARHARRSTTSRRSPSPPRSRWSARSRSERGRGRAGRRRRRQLRRHRARPGPPRSAGSSPSASLTADLRPSAFSSRGWWVDCSDRRRGHPVDLRRGRAVARLHRRPGDLRPGRLRPVERDVVRGPAGRRRHRPDHARARASRPPGLRPAAGRRHARCPTSARPSASCRACRRAGHRCGGRAMMASTSHGRRDADMDDEDPYRSVGRPGAGRGRARRRLTAPGPRSCAGTRPAVVARVRQFRLTPHQAEDVAQTVWLNLLENLEKLRDPHALPGWIATTARHECIRVTNVNRRTVPVDPQTGRLDGVVRLRPRRADAGGRARAGAARGARGAARRTSARSCSCSRWTHRSATRRSRRSSAFPSARSAPPGVVDSPACDRRRRSRTTCGLDGLHG